jgi:hypothetical protein
MDLNNIGSKSFETLSVGLSLSSISYIIFLLIVIDIFVLILLLSIGLFTGSYVHVVA